MYIYRKFRDTSFLYGVGLSYRHQDNDPMRVGSCLLSFLLWTNLKWRCKYDIFNLTWYVISVLGRLKFENVLISKMCSFFPGKWCPSRREWSSPPDVARRVYSSVFLGSPGEYPGMIVLISNNPICSSKTNYAINLISWPRLENYVNKLGRTKLFF